MLSKGFLLAMGAGLVVMSIFVGLILLKQRGATARLAGEITAVRTLGMDQSSSVAIVDFRFVNDSREEFIVESTEMLMEDGRGQTHLGSVLAAASANELFELFPALGLKSGETLIIKTKIPPGDSRLVMLAARFEVPKAALDARKKITVRVLEVDGAVSELSR